MRVGEILAGLINASLGNAYVHLNAIGFSPYINVNTNLSSPPRASVETIFAIVAVGKCELMVAQSALVGSILNNILLTLGVCFLVSGIRGFGVAITQLNSPLLTISVIAILLPAAFHVNDVDIQGQVPIGDEESRDILKMSRGARKRIVAVGKCELVVAQSALVGSILNNILLTLGVCFLVSGIRGFGVAITQLNSPLLTISVIAILLPAAFHVNVDIQGQVPIGDEESRDILKMSRGAAIILPLNGILIDGVVYVGYLVFQLYSHAIYYSEKALVYSKSTKYRTRKKKTDEENGIAITNATRDGALTSTTTHVDPHEEINEGPQNTKKELRMSLWMAIALSAVVTAFIAVTTEWLVESIDEFAASVGTSEEFVAVILIPLIGSIAEAVTVSAKDDLTLSMSITVASSIQLALFVIPSVVTLAWTLGKPLTLLFDPYESITLFLSVFVLNYYVQDSKSNWLEGWILLGLYAIIGTTFWFYPGRDFSSRGLGDLQCS
ncbi:hypothetical protein PQX77_016216 [Marasmius sp. AFHP31]|nr:hypothetical protein PQX77_016216 [Marasmius sp. AFHP31]